MKLLQAFGAVSGIFLLLAIPAVAHSAGEFSGFLEDYSGLQADPDRAGAMVFRAEGASLGKYGKVAIAPVEIWLAPDSPYKGVSPDELKLIADQFRAQLRKALEPAYPVVESPGADVLGLRVAIANVKLTKKGRSLLNYTPVGFAVYTVKDAAGANVTLSDAAIEAELIDSSSGKRLGILVDQQPATAKGAPSWESLDATLTFYAQRFRARLDADHGR
jgi:hypothetical protein